MKHVLHNDSVRSRAAGDGTKPTHKNIISMRMIVLCKGVVILSCLSIATSIDSCNYVYFMENKTRNEKGFISFYILIYI